MGHLGSLQVLFGSPVGCYCTTGYSLVGQSYQEKWRLLVASPTDRLRRRKVGFSQTWLMLERAIRSPMTSISWKIVFSISIYGLYLELLVTLVIRLSQ